MTKLTFLTISPHLVNLVKMAMQFFSNAVFKKMPFLRTKRWLFVRYYLDVLDTTTDSFPTYYLLTSYYDVQDGREMVAVRIYSSLFVLHYYLLITTLRFLFAYIEKKQYLSTRFRIEAYDMRN